MLKNDFVYIQSKEMQEIFFQILLKLGLTNNRALKCAEVFTTNSIDGVYTHGVNRFPVFVEYIKNDLIDKTAAPALLYGFGGIEQWTGNLGPGPLNAIHATERAIDLSNQYGISCVALANTNHWMRGGYYGWLAAKKNCVLIAWTNTIANMPAWNAVDCRLGNNPFIMALPYNNEAIVLDMAMSQFSFGAIEMSKLQNKKLAVNGGYNKDGKLTNDPADIIESKRVLPAGYWKGAGLSLLLDIVATILSGGLSTYEITKSGNESNISQVFVCINLNKLSNTSAISQTVNNIISDYHQSQSENGKNILYPGERILQTRKENLMKGIPVLKKIWDKILKL